MRNGTRRGQAHPTAASPEAAHGEEQQAEPVERVRILLAERSRCSPHADPAARTPPRAAATPRAHDRDGRHGGSSASSRRRGSHAGSRRIHARPIVTRPAGSARRRRPRVPAARTPHMADRRAHRASRLHAAAERRWRIDPCPAARQGKTDRAGQGGEGTVARHSAASCAGA